MAHAVDLFAQRRLHWVAADAMRYTLSAPDGILLLTTADQESWTVEHVARDRRRTVLATKMDLGFAQGTAEDYARRLGAGHLTDREAAWRRAPASDRQLAALQRWRVTVPPGLTKGGASDLLAIAVARA